MCGRFALTATLEDLTTEFYLKNSFLMQPRYNIAPRAMIPALCEPYKIEFLYWGFRFPWQNQEAKLQGPINARSETIALRPGFRQAYQKNRCLIPANGYYEWKNIGRQKQPFYISGQNNSLFAFAGIWSFDTCAILTRAANSFLEGIHPRMPVILPKTAYALWLNNKTPLNVLNDILACSQDAIDFRVYPVSPKMNNPRFDLQTCIQSLQ